MNHRQIISILVVLLISVCTSEYIYNIGKGKGDITAPLGIPMQGYADLFGQKSKGILFRQYARTFIVEDPKTRKRVVMVTIDYHSGYAAVKNVVIQKLKEMYKEYDHHNVEISGTHTHAGTAGVSSNFLYSYNAFGMVKKVFDRQVDGIVKSIEQAHKNMVKGKLSYGTASLHDANFNRAQVAYNQNPDAKSFSTNKDTTMKVLKFVTTDGKPFGSMAWFSVHPVSLNVTNELTCGDSKGYAANMMEAKLKIEGISDFVAAFPNGAAGDMSPNINGPSCPDGSPCDAKGACGKQGGFKKCLNKGPTLDQYENMAIIGERQYDAAMKAFKGRQTSIHGPVNSRYIVEKMSEFVVDAKFTGSTNKKTCKPTFGAAFTKGTQDGPGLVDLGKVKQTPNMVSLNTKALRDCQYPKLIAIPVPSPLTPILVPFQLFQIGNLFIPLSAGETTVMGGRRIKHIVYSIAKKSCHVVHPIVLYTTYANDYNQYTATPEEYEVQGYEAASTLYGPQTLNAHRQIFSTLTEKLCKKQEIEQKYQMPNFKPSHLVQLWVEPTKFDIPPFGASVGSVRTQPNKKYHFGQDVKVEIWSSTAFHGFERFSTLFEVIDKNGKVVRTDDDLDTSIQIRAIGLARVATIKWTPSIRGTFQICHYGQTALMFQKVRDYKGCTNFFTVE